MRLQRANAEDDPHFFLLDVEELETGFSLEPLDDRATSCYFMLQGALRVEVIGCDIYWADTNDTQLMLIWYPYCDHCIALV